MNIYFKLLILLVLCCCSWDAVNRSIAPLTKPRQWMIQVFWPMTTVRGVVKVMTWNIYVGTNVDNVLQASDLSILPAGSSSYDNFCRPISGTGQAIADRLKSTARISSVYRSITGRHYDVMETGWRSIIFLKFCWRLWQPRGWITQLADSVQKSILSFPGSLILFLLPPWYIYIRLVDADVVLVKPRCPVFDPVKGKYTATLPVSIPNAPDIIIPRGMCPLKPRWIIEPIGSSALIWGIHRAG